MSVSFDAVVAEGKSALRRHCEVTLPEASSLAEPHEGIRGRSPANTTTIGTNEPTQIAGVLNILDEFLQLWRHPSASTATHSTGYSSQVISSEAARLGQEAARRLARTGRCEIGPGLTDAEFARIEQDYEFSFADDHRAFLAAGLPLDTHVPGRWGNRWPDWRDGDPDGLREQLDWPIEGALFDVEHNAIWHPSWGQRPASTSEALGQRASTLVGHPR